jgi:hypothetical protein
MLLRVTISSVAALSVAVGWYQMFRISSTPGEQFLSPSPWPGDLPVPGSSGHAFGSALTNGVVRGKHDGLFECPIFFLGHAG